MGERAGFESNVFLFSRLGSVAVTTRSEKSREKIAGIEEKRINSRRAFSSASTLLSRVRMSFRILHDQASLPFLLYAFRLFFLFLIPFVYSRSSMLLLTTRRPKTSSSCLLRLILTPAGSNLTPLTVEELLLLLRIRYKNTTSELSTFFFWYRCQIPR